MFEKEEYVTLAMVRERREKGFRSNELRLERIFDRHYGVEAFTDVDFDAHCTPNLRIHHLKIRYPFEVIHSHDGKRPPSSHHRMVPLLIDEVHDWTRQYLEAPIEVIEFILEIPTPNRLLRGHSEEVARHRHGSRFLPWSTSNPTIKILGYAIEFCSLADSISFKIRWL